MGALLGLFQKEQVHQIDFFLDFQNFEEPTGQASDIYNQVRAILDRSNDILNQLENYAGCTDQIHTAISNPTPENEENTWNVLIPAVDILKDLFVYSNEIGEGAKLLLPPLCNAADLANQTALAKALCELFNFILKFDDMKMVNPHIQNDFSFFRRSMGKLKASGQADRVNVADDVANKMSLFYAYPTPMMNMLTTLVKDASIGVANEEIVEGLSLLANVCLSMVEEGNFDDPELNLFCLRAMTAAIVLVDHVSEAGVFNRRSPVNIKSAILTLREKENELGTTGLLNALKYTTQTLNSETTPNSIKNLLV
eukprot:TRINITY_DN3279_c0_g2_i2.p1 TRINITY_DN3279_c0_g2~~TRINITY_DN3279_c0_g2_i2.p1  ORF type:complete len:311 (-),score=81.61 TRINITY_DN3279_c0_g2_i2:74-1006(-)